MVRRKKFIQQKSSRVRRLELFKGKFGMEDCPNEEFIGWWSRNHGTGYLEQDREYLLGEVELLGAGAYVFYKSE